VPTACTCWPTTLRDRRGQPPEGAGASCGGGGGGGQAATEAATARGGGRCASAGSRGGVGWQPRRCRPAAAVSAGSLGGGGQPRLQRGRAGGRVFRLLSLGGEVATCCHHHILRAPPYLRGVSAAACRRHCCLGTAVGRQGVKRGRHRMRSVFFRCSHIGVTPSLLFLATTSMAGAVLEALVTLVFYIGQTLTVDTLLVSSSQAKFSTPFPECRTRWPP